MYVVQFLPAAAREYRKLPQHMHPAVSAAIDGLAVTPRASTRKLRGVRNTYRIRVGSYRILYEVDDRERVVLVVAIRHRRNAYGR